ncbi:ABC transporter permease [Actinoallomurus purpureus]|uniref:ABC transporter permease n=1 Tax=Actinoallomurus purpureus TaxID=478114 RepID=UPI002092910E|nr:ABC transporter permease [Actinoallomurus purpureus]MCO6006695.1 ABC transporter permease [Actinoallomurus purpureus]
MSVPYAVADAAVITRRHLRHTTRIPELLFFSIMQPIIFILLFTVVFANAIKIPGMDYKNYMMPAIFVQTMAFATAGTSVGLADDLHKGLIDRFRSLPMTRSAVLVGRLVAEAARNTLTLLIMIAAGYAVGFRFQNGVASAIGGILLLIAFAFAFSSIGTVIGLGVKSVEAANMAGMIWIFPLTFLSNGFVTMNSLPGWLQQVVRYSPVTTMNDALRAMFYGHGRAVATPALQSVAWIVGITLVFLLLGVRQYKKAASR